MNSRHTRVAGLVLVLLLAAAIGSGAVVDVGDADHQDDEENEEEDEEDEEEPEDDEDEEDEDEEEKGEEDDEDEEEEDEDEKEDEEEENEEDEEDEEMEVEGRENPGEGRDEDGLRGQSPLTPDPLSTPSDSETQSRSTPTPTATPSPRDTPTEAPSTTRTGTERPVDPGSMTIELDESAAVTVTDVSVNRSVVAAGEPVAITVTVANARSSPTWTTVRLRLFDEIARSERVRVPGDDSQEIRFVTAVKAPGTYRPSAGDEEAAFRVESTEEPDSPASSPQRSSGAGPGFTAALALAGLLAAVAGLAIRRR